MINYTSLIGILLFALPLFSMENSLAAYGLNHNLMILDQKGEPWFWENGAFSQLVFRGPDGVGVKKISGAVNHFLLLTKKNQVFDLISSRANDRAFNYSAYRDFPLTISAREKAEHIEFNDVAAGSNFFLLLDKKGNVWAMGKNDFGQLGLGDRIERKIPTKIDIRNAKGETIKIRAVAAGSLHSLLLDIHGRAWSFGYNVFGQLGLNTRTTILVPSMLQLCDELGTELQFQAVAAGINTSFLLASDGSVWAFGQNSNGQLSLGDYKNRKGPTKINGIDKKIISLHVATMTDEKAFIDIEGGLWYGGPGAYPGRFKFDSPFVAATANGWALTESHQLFRWSWASVEEVTLPAELVIFER